MITRRDLIVAVIAASGTFAVVAAQQPTAAILKSQVFDWTAMTAKDERLWFRAVDRPGADGDAQRARDARDDAQPGPDVARAAPAPE